jgi:hypothetical protein
LSERQRRDRFVSGDVDKFVKGDDELKPIIIGLLALLAASGPGSSAPGKMRQAL